MTEVSFYQLKRYSMERALLRLLEKALQAGERAVVRLAEEAEVPLMDTALWSVDPDSFLAHGTSKSARPEQQPVFLTAGQDNPAGAAFLLSCQAPRPPDLISSKGSFSSLTAIPKTRWRRPGSNGKPLKMKTMT